MGVEETYDFEFAEHTADKALVARGKDLEDLLECAAIGMFASTVHLETVPQEQTWQVEAQGETPEKLLLSFLRELVFLLETEGA